MEVLLGMVVLLPYSYTPRGFVPCDGRTLRIAQESALFSLLATNFGGDGTNTFGVPKLASPIPGLNYYIAVEGIYPERSDR